MLCHREEKNPQDLIAERACAKTNTSRSGNTVGVFKNFIYWMEKYIADKMTAFGKIKINGLGSQ